MNSLPIKEGDMGYISQDNEQVSKEYITAAEKIEGKKVE